MTTEPTDQQTTSGDSRIAEATDFSAIRYSQSWEDPRCLTRALEIEPTDTVLSIAAAGDNSLALLLDDPERVVSVDMNPSQVALVHLKIEAIRELDTDEMRELLGATASTRRVQLYERIRIALPSAARTYWDANHELIEAGVINQGKLEKYFATFRKYLLPITHGSRLVNETFEPRETTAERAAFYNDRFNTRRWQLIQRIFFSQAVLGRFGRDPAFFDHVQIDDVGAHYGGRTRHAVVYQPTSDNWYMQYILLGKYTDLDHAHPYLARQHHETLRNRLDRLEVHCDQLERYLRTQPAGSFDKFNLSDIFEWMDDDAYEKMLRLIASTSKVGGRLAYWNNLVLRSRPESMADILDPDRALAVDIHHDDFSFVYRDFQVEIVTEVPDRNGGST